MAKMEVTYVVHGTSTSSVPITTEHKGMSLQATIQCLEVELTGEDTRHGSTVLRFIGDEVEPARELFKPDARITVTFNEVGEEEEE